MAALIYISARSYGEAPPVSEKVVGPVGEIVFTGDDIREGQQVFLRYGLMDNGTVWGHGAYLGPDFSAEYLHTLGLDASSAIAHDLDCQGDRLLSRSQVLRRAPCQLHLRP